MISNIASNALFIIIITIATEETGSQLPAVQQQGRLLSMVLEGAQGVGPPSCLISAPLIHFLLLILR